MPRKRIIDERSGEPCDYAALAEECQALMLAERLTWRRAAAKVAEAASTDQADSIVRNLNRRRRRLLAGDSMPMLPGEAVLYDAVSEQLDRLESKLGSVRTLDPRPSDDRPYGEMAAGAAAIRGLLQGRLRILEEMPGKDSVVLASQVLGAVDLDLLSPGEIIQRECARLAGLIARVRQLQVRIDKSRPGPYVIEDY